ncbi:YodC family protein [Tritonibacter mobilis]|uniref:YodC family protein n=1 Tax=Tritonibacter mobilis TaxID=379347 RepID=UPI00398F9371
MSGNKFNPGDVVQLKAGGPKMVVEEWNPFNHAYKCSWFSGAKHNSQLFKEEAIQEYSEGDE